MSAKDERLEKAREAFRNDPSNHIWFANRGMTKREAEERLAELVEMAIEKRDVPDDS